MKLILFALVSLLLVSSCGTTLTQKFSMANEFARAASHNSMPLFRTMCDEAIAKCKAAGLKIEDRAECTGEVACRKARRVVVKTANAVHIGVKMGMYYIEIKDTKKAGEMLASVMRAVGELKGALQQAGFLEPLGIMPEKTTVVPPSVPIENSDNVPKPTSRPTEGDP